MAGSASEILVNESLYLNLVVGKEEMQRAQERQGTSITGNILLIEMLSKQSKVQYILSVSRDEEI